MMEDKPLYIYSTQSDFITVENIKNLYNVKTECSVDNMLSGRHIVVCATGNKSGVLQHVFQVLACVHVFVHYVMFPQ